MKARSLYQPYASLMALGLKKNETSSWATSYRGPLLIHAAKKIIDWPNGRIQAAFEGIAFLPSDLPLGCLLCKVDLIDCKKIFLYNRPKEPERSFGIYTLGRYMWITDNLEIFDPVPYRGRQRIFNVPADIISIEPKVKNLGWANGWGDTPEIVERCRKLKHQILDVDHSRMRGTNHEVRCDICGYVYRYDSS